MADEPQNQDFAGFSQTVIDHARNPRNVGTIPNPDGYASAVGSCGDIMEIWLRIKGDIIRNATFLTTGCGPTVAALSLVTELAKGKTIAEVRQITPEYVLNTLGGLPEENIECAVLAATILREAIRDYLAFKNEPWKRMYRQQG
jgi:nitrogen fixation NifU-like protein